MRGVTNDSPRRVRELPSWLVNQAALQAQRLVAEAGVRRHHFAVLAALEEGGAASQAELGRRVWMDRSDLHAVLNELEGDGLVARDRDAEDRRRNLVRLTPAGARVLERLNARVEEAQDALLTPLTAAERRELQRLLTRVVEHHAGKPS
jgi:MarR family transcriptional regulator, lower aerobic nicotinate degradation pathway regulator